MRLGESDGHDVHVDDGESDVSARASATPDTAGARLRAAREAAGLSIDVVAQQLKLAPRQVQALEDDDWERLPGRTFVRGFARNYARLLELDPDFIVGMLPASESAPALQRPALAAARRPMGEMPIEGGAKPSAARWLVAVLIVVVFAGAGYYEYTRQHSRDTASRSASSDVSASASQRPGAVAGSSTALPNPVASGGGAAIVSSSDSPGTSAATPSASSSSAPASPPTTSTAASPASSTSSTSSASPATSPGTPAPSSVTTTTPTPASVAQSASVASPTTSVSTASSPVAASSATPSTATEATLVLTFKGTSWAEVKDASGRVILQMTGGAGMTQTVSGTVPFELALGNAPEVGVSFRGQTLDLSPYTRGNVARVALR